MAGSCSLSWRCFTKAHSIALLTTLAYNKLLAKVVGGTIGSIHCQNRATPVYTAVDDVGRHASLWQIRPSNENAQDMLKSQVSWLSFPTCTIRYLCTVLRQLIRRQHAGLASYVLGESPVMTSLSTIIAYRRTKHLLEFCFVATCFS